MSTKPKPKPIAQEREDLFIAAYLANGHVASKAAIAAGFPEGQARRSGQYMLRRKRVRDNLEARAKTMADAMLISAERTLREAARIAYFDPLKLYDEKGQLRRVIDLDEDTRRAIASIELTPIISGGAVVGVRKKVQHWSKTEALDKLFRHLGLYEKDNAQTVGFAERLVRARERARERKAA